MNKEDLHNGKYRLTAPNGVVDMRNGRVYSEVIVSEDKVKYFKAKEA